MQKISLIYILTCIASIAFWRTAFPMSLLSLKKTYTIFTEPYHYLSPLNGALLWESGVLKNYYDAGLAAQHDDHWLPITDAPIRLTHALFNSRFGNFDISNNPSYPAKHVGVPTVANIIALLELNRRNAQPVYADVLENLIISDTSFADSVEQTEQAHKNTHAVYETQIKECEAKGLQDMIPQLRHSCTVALNKLDTKRLRQDWTRRQTIAQIRARLEQIDQLTGPDKIRAQKERYLKARTLEQLRCAKSGGDYNRVRELAQSIIDAYTPSAYYPPHCALSILMAFMYRKSTGKQDLAHYINLLAKKLGPTVCKPVDVLWTHDLFNADNLAIVKQIVSTFKSDLQEISEPTLYEAITWAQITERFYRGTFPKIAEYTNVYIQGILFPNCVEVTLRNFCNMIFYDRQAGVFDVNRPGLGTIDQAMADFYTDPTNRSAYAIEQPLVHHAWDTMLQNLPFITYRMLIVQTTGGTKTVLSAPKDTNGFIYGLPEHILKTLPRKEDRILIAGRWYIHVTNSQAYLCEMHPTIRNVIIILNKLFNLNLFADIPLEHVFLQEKFNATYLPLLCQHFTLLSGMQWTTPLLTSLDRDEYTEKGIHLEFPRFDLILTDEHAEIISHVKGGTIADLGPGISQLVSQLPDTTKRWQLAQLLSIFPIEATQLPQANQLPYLLYLPLYNNQAKINATVLCIQKIFDQNLSSEDRKQYTNRAISFIRQLPERLDWHYHEELINRLDEQALRYEPVIQEFERILSVAKDRLSRDSAECEYVPNLYTALINKGQQRDDVMIVADNLLSRTDQFDRRPLLNLLILLAKQGHAYPQARQAIELCSNNSIEAERLLAQTLREILQAH